MAEIEAEARMRRLQDDDAMTLEGELDAGFDRLVPKDVGTDFSSALRRAQQDARIDYEPPTASVKPAGAVAKKGISKLTSWYVRYVGSQIASFAVNTVNALSALGERVGALEAQVGIRDAADVARFAARVRPYAPTAYWNDTIVTSFGGETGRVLVSRVGDGELLAALVCNGVGAYGIEPPETHAVGIYDAKLEVHPGTPALHLEAVPEGELVGAVLIGTPDELTLGGALEIAARLKRALRPNAPALLVVTNPRGQEAGGAVASDLMGRDPLAPETWRAILADQGFEDIEIRWAPVDGLVADLPGDDPLVQALNERLRALGDAIAISPSACIFARCPQ